MEVVGECGVSHKVEPPPSDFAAAQAQSDIPSFYKEGRFTTSNLKPQTSNGASLSQSVLNGEAGNPSLLYKFAPSGLLAQA